MVPGRVGFMELCVGLEKRRKQRTRSHVYKVSAFCKLKTRTADGTRRAG